MNLTLLIRKSALSLVFILSVLAFGSCDYEDVPEFNEAEIAEIEGYSPIYSEVTSTIDIIAPQEYVNPTNVYKYEDHLFISESGGGFHIVNNSDPSSPMKTGYFTIPLNNNIAVKGNVVYADSGRDLLALSMEADGSIAVRRSEDMFTGVGVNNLPPESGYYFECVEDDLGRVVGWEKTTIYNPECYF